MPVIQIIMLIVNIQNAVKYNQLIFVNGIQTNVDACNYDEEGGETVVSFTPVATDSGAVYTLFGVNFS